MTAHGLTLGEQIKGARKALKLSQPELAEQVGVSRETVSHWETNGRVPLPDNLVSLRRALRLSADALQPGEAPTVEGTLREILEVLDAVRVDQRETADRLVRLEHVVQDLRGQ